MSDHADIIRRLHELDPHRGWETAACQDALTSLDALVAENQQLRDALEMLATTIGLAPSDALGTIARESAAAYPKPGNA